MRCLWMLIFFILFFLFFLKSRLLLQVLTQESLATVVTGVMVPAGAVTQPLLIPIGITGPVAGQQGLAVWTIPTATVAALPGLTAASPTGGTFKPPLAGLQGNGNSPQDCTRPPPPYAANPARLFTMLDSQATAHPGQQSGFWLQCYRHPATEPPHCPWTLGQDTRLARRPAFRQPACLRLSPPPQQYLPRDEQERLQEDPTVY